MKILEDGSIRIEYKNNENKTYLYKDITPEFVKKQKENKNMTFTVKNNINEDLLNGFNDIAECSFLDNTDICMVQITEYDDENRKYFWLQYIEF